jgi:hypothetical protein
LFLFFFTAIILYHIFYFCQDEKMFVFAKQEKEKEKEKKIQKEKKQK